MGRRGLSRAAGEHPVCEAMLRRRLPLKCIERVRGDTAHYVYADRLVCNCLYVGSQESYIQFKLHEQQQRLTDEQLSTSQVYSVPSMEFGRGGPGPCCDLFITVADAVGVSATLNIRAQALGRPYGHRSARATRIA